MTSSVPQLAILWVRVSLREFIKSVLESVEIAILVLGKHHFIEFVFLKLLLGERYEETSFRIGEFRILRIEQQNGDPKLSEIGVRIGRLRPRLKC